MGSLLTQPHTELHRGDCLEFLRSLATHSVDSIVTDPPAGIAFMGAEWDKDRGGRDLWIGWMADIAAEARRVIKPGGHAFVWALPRTSHWTATAWENGGWEPRDRVCHVFGTGFPKSHDISKAIDKAAGAEREAVGVYTTPDGRDYTLEAAGKKPRFNALMGEGSSAEPRQITAPATDAAQQWDGWGTALKPAAEDWWLFRAPLSEDTVAANVLKHGTGGLNIDGSRIGIPEDKRAAGTRRYTVGHMAGGATHREAGIVQAAPHGGQGRFPANLILSHSLFCEQDGDGWQCEEGCPVRVMGEQSGESKSPKPGSFQREMTSRGYQGGGLGQRQAKDHDQTAIEKPGHADTGTAARFFLNLEPEAPFFYCAKPGSNERDAGCEAFEEQQWVQWQTANGTSGKASSMSADRDTKRRNTHPTVKAVALMRYLCRLVTPPGGTVLDLFMGSGSTGVAAVLEGFSFTGCEREAEFFGIAEARIQHALTSRGVIVQPVTTKTAVAPKRKPLSAQSSLWEALNA